MVVFFCLIEQKKGRFEVCIPEFCRIYNDVTAFTDATEIGKSTVYRWLHGTPPSLPHINQIQKFLNIQLSVDYVIEFNKISKQAAEINEIDLLQEIVNESKLTQNDKIIISDFHKKRIWHRTDAFLDGDIE
jgi:hypothetical protein